MTALMADQLSQLNAIVTQQLQLAPQDQSWVAAYKLIADAIQNAPNVSAGVKYFFSNAGAANANDPNSPQNVFVRIAYKAGASLQGVTLSDSQVQAVSGNIGNAILSSIAITGVVPDRIEPIVDDDIYQAVTNIPGVSQPLSFAIWGAALFVESKLGYQGFYTKYFTTPQDWSIFYSASEAACIQTAQQFPGQLDQGLLECAAIY